MRSTKRCSVHRRCKTAILNCALLLIGAGLLAQPADFSTGFEDDDGYTAAEIAEPATLLVPQQGWETQFGDDNFHVYTYDDNEVPWIPLGAGPAPYIAPQNPNGGEQFVGLGNGGRDMHVADFTGFVEMSVDYIAGPEFDNSGGNYNGALTARPENVAGFYSARSSTAKRGVDPSTDPWAPWFRVWDENDDQIVTDELIAYRFDGVEGFDNLSRAHWYRIGLVIDTDSGIVVEIKSQELIPGGRIWTVDEPTGPLGQTLYIDSGAANTSPLERVGIYNVGNGTVSCFDNVYVGAPYEWEPVPSDTTESFRRGDTDRNGTLELTDGIGMLNFLFLGGAMPGCLDSADSDDNGRIELSDAVGVFGFLFLGAAPPETPGPTECGVDPTDDGLDCAEYGSCA